MNDTIMATQLPTPTPSPPPPAAATPSLSTEINTTTRTLHTTLNRLIIHRLPLALPPHTSTPALYTKGLHPFAQLFLLFEAEWALLAQHTSTSTSTSPTPLTSALATLRPTALARSTRLKADLPHLRDISTYPSHARAPTLGETWTNRMRAHMRRKPHTLLAFAWVLYMALFSGGRWMRDQLAGAGAGFWRDGSNQLGFSFLSFDGEADGEDLKTAFKARFAQVEVLLTEGEREEVVQTAGEIFERCIGLVHELDRAVWWEEVRGRMPKMAAAVVVPALMLAWYYYSGKAGALR